MCRPCTGRGCVRGPNGFHDPCADCDGTGQAEPVKALPIQQHVRQMIRTAWALGHLPEFSALKLWKWAPRLAPRPGRCRPHPRRPLHHRRDNARHRLLQDLPQ
jgi:hypothetical protein